MEKILPSDVLTPMMAYMRLSGKNKMILESIPREKENARFSIIAYNPVHEIRYEKGNLWVDNQKIDADPLDYLYKITKVASESSSLPFSSGAIGYVGYDMVSLYEDIGKIPADTIGTPDMHFFLYESYLLFDHKTETIRVIEENCYSNRCSEDEKAAIDSVLTDLNKPTPQEISSPSLDKLSFEPHIEQSDFEKMVKKTKSWIRNGDMFQCVISQRFSTPFKGKAIDYYRNLRVTNPSNYLYLYDFGDYQVMGASPESLVSVKKGEVTTNPIAGTRPRGQNEMEDQQLAKSLSNDEKEVSEHRMLVDLGRNDIGKIAEIGSVKVTKYMDVEFFRYVMHLTSVVKGKLCSNVTAMDALKSTLPAGTVSGAPKIRAMNRIYELEKEKRGIYAGAIGYLSASGNMDFAIAIRTMIIKNSRAYVQSGAGIVYDSVPENEFYETINKAKAMTQIGGSL